MSTSPSIRFERNSVVRWFFFFFAFLLQCQLAVEPLAHSQCHVLESSFGKLVHKVVLQPVPRCLNSVGSQRIEKKQLIDAIAVNPKLLSLQVEFVEARDHGGQCKVDKGQRLTHLEEAFDSLVTQVFKGLEIGVQDAV